MGSHQHAEQLEPWSWEEPFGAGEQGGERGLGKDPWGDTSRKGQTTLLLLDGRVSG